MPESSSQQTTQRASESSPNGRGGSSNGGAPGEGIDRRIEKKTFTPKRIGLALAGLLVVGVLAYLIYGAATGGQALNVERDKLTVSTVTEGPFQEFIAVTGAVTPRNTVYLDAVEGGRVEEVFVKEGAMVKQGEKILRLSNSDLRLQLMNHRTRLSEQVSNLQNMRFQIEQSRLQTRQQIAEMDYQVRKLRKEYERQKRLVEKDLIAPQKFEETKDELQYQKRRKKLTERSFRQDSLSQASRIRQMQQSVERMRRSFRTLQGTMDNLTVRAPRSGQLTSLDAEVGEIISTGSRLGQVDVLENYKLQAQIDEFYIERVRKGQTATTRPLGGEQRAMTVTRVYPEVEEGQFRIDLAFQGDGAPEGLRRGQTIRFRLKLGSPEQAVLLDRGGFYQSTGGNWIYALSGDGEAVRRPVELGRQNPEHFEVLGGLEPGDRVVTSSYETFGEADRLVLE
jgi:HlyD family secretion protein